MKLTGESVSLVPRIRHLIPQKVWILNFAKLKYTNQYFLGINELDWLLRKFTGSSELFFFFFSFFFYQGFLSQTLMIHRTARGGRGPSFIPLFPLKIIWILTVHMWKGARFFDAELFYKNPSTVLMRRLHSFHWTFLEISVTKRAFVLSQKLTHSLP